MVLSALLEHFPLLQLYQESGKYLSVWSDRFTWFMIS